MPLVSGTIPNLVNGVSQQPPALRLRTSCEAMDNAYPSVVSGLQKRPPSQFVAELLASQVTQAHIHVIDRKTLGQHAVLITDGDLKVFNLTTGVEETVTFPDGKAYLSTTNPRTDFRCLTVADTTFVLNRTITTASTAVAEDGSRIDPALRGTAYIKQAVARINYNLYIDSVLQATFQTADGTTASTVVEGTDQIAADLASDLTGAGYTVITSGSTLSITMTSDEVLQHTDGFADKGMGSYKDAVQKFGDLPPDEQNGRVVKVKGDIDENADDYYVEYEDGVYSETYGYGAGETLDNTTMYHELVNTSVGNWVFRLIDFGSRIAGDSDSNPSPSFVGNTIKDIFLYEGRLGLLSDENLVLSEVAEYNNFYRTTVVQLLDTDPIDIASTTNRTSIMESAVPFNETLLLFSDKTQFRLPQQDVLSPGSVSLKVTTSYNFATDVRAINVGPNVVFADDGEGNTYASLREYFVEADTNADDASEITAQVPEYIPSGVYKMASSPGEDLMVTLTTGEVNTIFVYKYYWGTEGKLQSSWGRWTFPSDVTILSADFIDNFLYFVYSDSNGTYLDKINVEQGVVDFGDRFGMLIDRRVTNDDVTGITYDVATNTTSFTMPYDSGISEPQVFTIKDDTEGALASGLKLSVVSHVGTNVVINGNHVNTKFAVGIGYEFAYTFSPFYVRQQSGGGEVALQDGRLQVRNIKVLYDNTAYFTVSFTPEQRDTFTTVFSGRNLGSANNVLGQIPLEKGSFTIPCPGQNDKITVTIKNDSPFPCAFASAEWTGMYYPNARRV